jgi:hypothetical protein
LAACFRSFGFEFQGPCSAFTSWEVGREGEVARLKWSKFFGHIHDSTLIVGRSSIARASRSFQRLHWLKRASTEVPPWCKYDRAERNNNKE